MRHINAGYHHICELAYLVLFNPDLQFRTGDHSRSDNVSARYFNLAILLRLAPSLVASSTGVRMKTINCDGVSRQFLRTGNDLQSGWHSLKAIST